MPAMPKNVVTDLEFGGLGAASLDNAGRVAAKRARQAALLNGWVLAVSDIEIDGIDACSFHSHQYLGSVGKRGFDLVSLKDIRAAEAVNAHQGASRSWH